MNGCPFCGEDMSDTNGLCCAEQAALRKADEADRQKRCAEAAAKLTRAGIGFYKGQQGDITPRLADVVAYIERSK